LPLAEMLGAFVVMPRIKQNKLMLDFSYIVRQHKTIKEIYYGS
jgi:hypothetical protein